MPTLKLFAIHDQKAQAFLQPFFLPTIPMAIRDVTELVNDNKHQFGKYSSDYTLYTIGEFSQETGQLVSYSETRLVGNLIEFKMQQDGSAVIPAFLKQQAD